MPNEHDAFCVSAWLAETDGRGPLDYYFKPPLSVPELRQTRLEAGSSAFADEFFFHPKSRYTCGTPPNFRPLRQTNTTYCFSLLFPNCFADPLIQLNQ